MIFDYHTKLTGRSRIHSVDVKVWGGGVTVTFYRRDNDGNTWNNTYRRYRQKGTHSMLTRAHTIQAHMEATR